MNKNNQVNTSKIHDVKGKTPAVELAAYLMGGKPGDLDPPTIRRVSHKASATHFLSLLFGEMSIKNILSQLSGLFMRLIYETDMKLLRRAPRFYK